VAGRKGSHRDSCKGDSGGPAYVFVDNSYKLAGTTSRATDEAMDVCGDGGVYVRADGLAAWIEEAVRGLPGASRRSGAARGTTPTLSP
jgi:secreted trypsin-like serine protease